MPPSTDSLAHSPRHLTDPTPGWVLYLSHSQPRRLVVFVHGFWGGAVKTWRNFPDSGRLREWWRSADMLFVGYPSGKESISGTAYRLVKQLPRFFPMLPQDLLEERGVSLRSRSTRPYSELLLVGHSLGGVVVRRALCEAARSWIDLDTLHHQTSRPALLDADVRLFSPASAGFRPSGLLGQVHATPLWSLIRLKLQSSSAFNDLQQGSQFLSDTRKRTEVLVTLHPTQLSALRARVLWANPDNVVVTETYTTDYSPHSADWTNHTTVCKPCETYLAPWNFVERGEVP